MLDLKVEKTVCVTTIRLYALTTEQIEQCIRIALKCENEPVSITFSGSYNPTAEVRIEKTEYHNG